MITFFTVGHTVKFGVIVEIVNFVFMMISIFYQINIGIILKRYNN